MEKYINKSRKYILLLGCILLVIGLMNQKVHAFEDLNPSGESTPYIEEFYERGLIQGYPDGTFRPQREISRAEFVTLINRTFGYTEQSGQLLFSDVKGNEWFAEQLRITNQVGYIQGYPDRTFRPSRSISRQEVAVVLNRILGYTPEGYTNTKDAITIWARNDVQSLLAQDIMFLQNGSFNGATPITREDTVISLLTILHKKEQSENPTQGEPVITNNNAPTNEVIYAMEVTISELNEVLSGSTSYARKLTADHLRIIQDIQLSMEKYLADYSYDYEGAADAINIRYHQLPTSEQGSIENAINASVPYIYLDTLKQFFGNQ